MNFGSSSYDVGTIATAQVAIDVYAKGNDHIEIFAIDDMENPWNKSEQIYIGKTSHKALQKPVFERSSAFPSSVSQTFKEMSPTENNRIAQIYDLEFIVSELI